MDTPANLSVNAGGKGRVKKERPKEKGRKGKGDRGPVGREALVREGAMEGTETAGRCEARTRSKMQRLRSTHKEMSLQCTE